jgi:phenylpropionate dioxygenase-like ring-hydroxylating dioxygenase large terminal subunit
VDAMHIPIAHPGLSGLVGNSYGLEVSEKGGFIHKMWGDLNKTRKNITSNTLYKEFLPKVNNLSLDQQMNWVYYRLWPNLAFDVYPDQMDFMQFIPISASETIIREIPFALEDNRREMAAARYLNWRINRQVNTEDTQLINWVQEGMNTSGFNKGPLAKTEACLIDSNQKIQNAIPVAKMDAEPSYKDIFSINDELLKENLPLRQINKKL